MPPSPRWYDTSNVPLAAPLSLAATGGTPSAPVAVRLINNLGGVGASAITNARIYVQVRAAGSSDPFVRSGQEAVDRHFFQIRTAAGVNITLALGAYVPVGTAAMFRLPVDLGNDEGIELEIALDPPADAETVEVEFQLRLIDDGGNLIADGLRLALPDGIYHGIGDPGFSALLRGGDVVEDPGGPSANVSVPLLCWNSRGREWTRRAGLAAVTPAAAGKEKWLLLSGAADGALTSTYGAEVTAPAALSDRPAPPDFEPMIAWVRVDDSGTVEDADIENVWQDSLGLLALVSISALTATYAAGPDLVVDGWQVYSSGILSATVLDDATSQVLALRDRTLQVLEAGAINSASSRGHLLYEHDAAAGAVTASRDRRRAVGGTRYAAAFALPGEADGATYAYAELGNPAPAQLDPISPLVAVLADPGDGSAGSVVFDVEVLRGAAWEHLQADAADRPAFLHGTAAEDCESRETVPDDWSLPAFARLRLHLSEIPTGGGTGPTGVAVLLSAWCP